MSSLFKPEAWSDVLSKTSPYLLDSRKNNLVYLLDVSNQLSNKLNQKSRSGSNKFDGMRFISLYYFSHGYQIANAMLNLCHGGLGGPACILARSQVEAVIDFSYLYLCKKINGKEDEREAWFDFKFIRRSSVYTKWKEFQKHNNMSKFSNVTYNEQFIETAQLFEKRASEFKEKFKRSHWAEDKYTHLDKRARAVDNTGFFKESFNSLSLEENHILLYKWASEFTHGESGSLDSYVQNDEHKFFFDEGPSPSHVNTAAGAAVNMLLINCFLFERIHHLNIDIAEELSKRDFYTPEWKQYAKK